MADTRASHRVAAPRRCRAARIGLLLALAASGRAAPGAAAEQVQVRSVDADRDLSGELVELSGEGVTVRAPFGMVRHIPRRDLKSLLVADAPDEPIEFSQLPQWRLQLLNGDVCTAQSVGLEGESLELHGIAATDWRVPLESVRGVVRWTGDALTDAAAARRALSTPVAADTLLLTNGDRLTGELRAWDAAALQWEGTDGLRIFADADVAGLIFDPQLTVSPPRAAAWTVVESRRGDRLTCAAAAPAGDRWRLQPETGGSLNPAWSAVARIDFFGERVRPLTLTPPTEFVSAGTLSPVGRYAIDRNIFGGPLSLRDQHGSWGVGTGSGSRLVWELDGTWTWFDSTVGLDVAAAGRGSVEFFVLADDVVCARSGVIRGDDPSRVLGPVDIRDVRRLELAVEPADRGDICDFADWLRPCLVK